MTGIVETTRADAGLLAGLTAEQRRQVLAAARPRRFATREVLFHQGDPGGAVHLVAAGRLAERVHTPNGEVTTMLLLGPGGTVGELAAYGRDGRHATTVVALEPTQTWALSREQLDRLRRCHPSVDDYLLGSLTGTVQRLSALLLDALYLTSHRRVLRRLAELERDYRGPGPTTEIPLTQDEVASIAGAARGTVNQVLREAQAHGMLRLRRRRIEVVDRTALARRAG